MKYYLLVVILFLGIDVFAQKDLKAERVTDHSTLIKRDDFEAIIFDDKYVQRPGDATESNIKRFTPTISDVELAETILLNELKKRKYNRNGKTILKHLSYYRRQYMGYFDKNGNKVIYINSFPKDFDWPDKKVKGNDVKKEIPQWYDSIFQVFDGGNDFWQSHISLSEKKVQTIYTNGVA